MPPHCSVSTREALCCVQFHLQIDASLQRRRPSTPPPRPSSGGCVPVGSNTFGAMLVLRTKGKTQRMSAQCNHPVRHRFPTPFSAALDLILPCLGKVARTYLVIHTARVVWYQSRSPVPLFVFQCPSSASAPPANRRKSLAPRRLSTMQFSQAKTHSRVGWFVFGYFSCHLGLYWS